MFTGGIAWPLNWVAPDGSARCRESPAYPATNGDDDKLARPRHSRTADLTCKGRRMHRSNASCRCKHHSAALLRASVGRRPARDLTLKLSWPRTGRANVGEGGWELHAAQRGRPKCGVQPRTTG
jgi:hypothetical protein